MKIGFCNWTLFSSLKKTSSYYIYSPIFKNLLKNICTSSSSHFSMTGKIVASGDVTSFTNEVGGIAALTK